MSKIKPDALYAVELTKSVKVGRIFVNPNEGPKLRGDALAQVIASDPQAVTSYKEI